MSLFKRRSGFSLVSVLVAAAITAIIALAITTLMNNMSRSHKSVLQSVDAAMLMSEINLLLSNSQVCEKNFGPISLGGAITLGSTLLTRDLVDAAGNVAFDVGSGTAYENGSISIENYKYEVVQVVSNSPYTVVGRLTFNLDKTIIGGNISVGGKDLTRSLILTTTLTGVGGTVVTCGSVGSQSNLLTMSCPSGQTVTSFVSGVPVCSALPISMTCPVGQVMMGINAGVPVCVIPPSGSPSPSPTPSPSLTLTCPAGQVLSGINSGVAVCQAVPTIVASNYGTNGYIQYSSGFTVQWGRYYFGNTPTYTINYNLPFSVVYSVVISGTDCNSGGCQDESAAVLSIGTSNFRANSARDSDHWAYWMAYGSR